MTHRVRRARAVLAGTAAAVTVLAAALVTMPSAQAAAPICDVQYQVTNDWGSGATTTVTVTNVSGVAVNGWTVGWTFPGNQTIGDIWNATKTQSGANATASNVSWNAGIPNGGSVSFGFNLSYSGSNPAPTAFTLNGTGCGGATPPSPTPTGTPTTSPSPTGDPSPTTPPAGNLALNRPTTASSNEGTGLTSDLAVDGNRSTRWSSTYSDPQWIQVDLGATYPISQVTLRWEAAYARAYQIQTSTDGTTWTTVSSTTSGDGSDDVLAVDGSGRYVRMSGTARGTAWGYSLYEFEVYAVAPTPTPTPTGPSCG